MQYCNNYSKNTITRLAGITIDCGIVPDHSLNMLSDTEILEAINEQKTISITDFDKNYLRPVGYDLRVGVKGFSWNKKCSIDIETKKKIQIDAKDTVVIQTLESITLSKQVSATIHSIVSNIINHGLSDISTTVYPGWNSKLLITIHNHRNSPTELSFKDKLCRICFYNLKREATTNNTKEIDRQDLWDVLLKEAREEKQRVKNAAASENKRLADELAEEQSKVNYQNKDRNRYLICVIIITLSVGIFFSIYIPAVGGSLATFIAIVFPIIYDRFLKPIPKL